MRCRLRFGRRVSNRIFRRRTLMGRWVRSAVDDRSSRTSRLLGRPPVGDDRTDVPAEGTEESG